MEMYERQSEEIIKITKRDDGVTISTAMSLPIDTCFGLYHTAITIGDRLRNIAEGYKSRGHAVMGHEIFVNMTYDELCDFHCVEYWKKRSDKSFVIASTKVSREIYKEEIRDTKEKDRQKNIEEGYKRELVKLQHRIVSAIIQEPNSILTLIGKREDVARSIEHTLNQMDEEYDGNVDSLFYPYEIFDIKDVIELIERRFEPISGKDSEQVIETLKYVYEIHGNNASVGIKRI